MKECRQSSTFGLLLAALLENGVAMTLAQVAARFESVGVTSADKALASLKRCKPGRPPLYRDGDHTHIVPHDHEVDLWVFRLDLRPPRVSVPRVDPPNPAPLPSPEIALGIEDATHKFRQPRSTASSASARSCPPNVGELKADCGRPAGSCG